MQVSACEPWLCEAVAGQASARRPLSRSGMFKLLRAGFAPAVAEGDGTPDDKIQDLSFDDAAAVGPPEKRHRRQRGSIYKGIVVRTQAVPASPTASAVAENRRVLVAINAKKMYIEVNALSWLVNYLRTEFESGFVPAVAPAPEPDDTPGAMSKLWWDFRDDCWVGRVGQSGRRSARKSKAVKARMATGGGLSHLSFADAKQYCYDELAAELSDGGVGDVAAAAACGATVGDGDGAAVAALA